MTTEGDLELSAGYDWIIFDDAGPRRQLTSEERHEIAEFMSERWKAWAASASSASASLVEEIDP